jgi:hypothetical protein
VRWTGFVGKASSNSVGALAFASVEDTDEMVGKACSVNVIAVNTAGPLLYVVISEVEPPDGRTELAVVMVGEFREKALKWYVNRLQYARVRITAVLPFTTTDL